MQTFLPYRGFELSAQTLDYKRLGKQRVEAFQVLNVLLGRTETKARGWVNHPITRMWKGYENALKLYTNVMIDEWIFRGYNNTMVKEDIVGRIEYPQWIGNDLFHSSHRANLLRKDNEFYSKYIWNENPSSPYAWFDTDKKQWYLQIVSTGIREYL